MNWSIHKNKGNGEVQLQIPQCSGHCRTQKYPSVRDTAEPRNDTQPQRCQIKRNIVLYCDCQGKTSSADATASQSGCGAGRSQTEPQSQYVALAPRKFYGAGTPEHTVHEESKAAVLEGKARKAMPAAYGKPLRLSDRGAPLFPQPKP